MGFFSWDCKVCGHPMLSPAVTTGRTGWMSQVVAIEPNGTILRGEYDGYGRIDGRETDGAPECYHQRCWDLAGRPVNYTEESESSRDQGFFFDDDDHNVGAPKSLEEAQAARPKVGK